MRSQELPAKIKATNRANAEAMATQTKLLDFFRQYVGQRIFKADGSLFAKIEGKWPDLPYEPSLRFWRPTSDYTLSWRVSACENYGDHTCTYAEAAIPVGVISNGVLTELVEPVPLRTDYSLDEVLALRESAKEARRVYDAAKDACWPFGAD